LTKEETRRLMIAQDTGSAIVGPTRADLYWVPAMTQDVSPVAFAIPATS